MGQGFLTKQVKLLIALSFCLTVARAITLPVVAVYLSQTLFISQAFVGYILGISLAFSVAASLFGGYVVDHVSRRMLLCCGFIVLASSSLILPILNGWVSVLLVLTVTYAVISLIEITIKACLAHFVDVSHRIKAFSLTYTVNAMGYAVGPLLGALIALYDLSSLFYAAGFISLLALFFLAKLWSVLSVSNSDIYDGAPRSFVDTLNVLHHDKTLVTFVMSGILAAVIHARWSAYLAQYLAVVLDARTAYQTVAYIIATNAIAVVLLQYSVGSRVSVSNIYKYISVGLLLFAVSLGVFALSNALWVWILAILIFSVGEVLFTPASYLFVDKLAPEEMKGSYYGALNLTNLGGAVSPVVCGLLLSSSAPVSIFPFLIVVLFLSFLYLRKANRR